MLILEGVKTPTLASKELHKAFKNSSEQFEINMTSFCKWRNKIMKLKFKKNAIFFVNSSLEAIVHLVPKTLFT